MVVKVRSRLSHRNDIAGYRHLDKVGRTWAHLCQIGECAAHGFWHRQRRMRGDDGKSGRRKKYGERSHQERLFDLEVTSLDPWLLPSRIFALQQGIHEKTRVLLI